MSRKSYLADQYKLMSLKTSDLFTAKETEIFRSILEIKTKLKDEDEHKLTKEEKKQLNAQKKELNELLKKEINSDKNRIREINIEAVCDIKTRDENGKYPEAIEWDNLKLSRQIQEFCSEGSRLLGIGINEVSWDKIIIAWKSIDVLKQLIMNGFIAKIKIDGKVVVKKYRFMTASAGQLRRDKVQFISVDGYDRMYNSAYAGLTWDKINAHKGINANKLMAYYGLTFSATERWKLKDGSKFSIRHCLVIPDFEAHVEGEMDYIYRVDKDGNKIIPGDIITQDVKYIDDIRSHIVEINHCDGIGMKLPKVNEISEVESKNDMVRSAWIKGLLTEFDYVKFCEEKNIPCVIKDRWGLEHDLIKEEIWVLFTDSQLKLAKYYDSWEDYCKCWEENDCWLCRTNYDETIYPDNPNEKPKLKSSSLNYQFLQTLTEMTEEEILAAIKSDKNAIKSIATNAGAMLKTLGYDKGEDPKAKCCKAYNALLRDVSNRESLKQAKTLMTKNLKSGVLNCNNKRVYVIPDMYAACEFWFQGIKEPKGLLENGEVYCPLFDNNTELDILRSPHLYMEHAIRTNVVRQELQKWFPTGGVYTSCHDLISRILQFDCDGDMLNLCNEKWLINAAKRTIDKYHIIPLFYDAVKAPSALVSNEAMFEGLEKAHNSSNIGEISNSLTRLWNNEEAFATEERARKSIRAAGWITYMNNRVIDAAKTGDPCKYPPEVKAIVDEAIGEKKMPYFFRFSKNGRRADDIEKSSKNIIKEISELKKFKKNHRVQATDENGRLLFQIDGSPKTVPVPEDIEKMVIKDFADKTRKHFSMMNELCLAASTNDKGNIKEEEIQMCFREIAPFSYRMLFGEEGEQPINNDIRDTFNFECGKVVAGLVADGTYDEGENDEFTVEYASKLDLGVQRIKKVLFEKYTKEECFNTILSDEYAGNSYCSKGNKKFFWIIFGDMVLDNLTKNLRNYTVCPKCKQWIPYWDKHHICQEVDDFHYRCQDCKQIFEKDNSKDTTKNKAKIKRCPQCQEEYTAASKRKKSKVYYETVKAEEAQKKINEFRNRILSELQYDVKIG